MVSEKIYKPITCDVCPVVRKDKKFVWCGVKPELKALKQNKEQRNEIWKKCPIAWDKKENKNWN